MGIGGEKKPMHEISSTQKSVRDEAFEEIIEKLKTAGAQIQEDDTHPLYIDIGDQEFEIGEERTVKFELKGTEFILNRKVETHILQGAGHQKHIELLDSARIHISLKKKPPLSNDWQAVDFEDMF